MQRAVGVSPAKALLWGLGSVLQWVFVLPRPCCGAWAVLCSEIPPCQSCAVGPRQHLVVSAHPISVVGPRQCVAVGVCPAKALQWGLGSVLWWVLALSRPMAGPR